MPNFLGFYLQQRNLYLEMRKLCPHYKTVKFKKRKPYEISLRFCAWKFKIVRDTRGQFPTCFFSFETRCSDRFLKLDKERFPPRSNLTRNKALEKKEDKTISLICSSFFQMIKRRKMMSSLIPCLSSASVLALSSCSGKFAFGVLLRRKTLLY